jgi:hypothetical protein
MKSVRRIVVSMSAVAVAAAFALTTDAGARGISRGAGEKSDGESEGPNGDVPLAKYPGMSDPGTESPGAIDFGTGGGQQRDVHRDVFARRCREELRDMREDSNRRTADPSSSD